MPAASPLPSTVAALALGAMLLPGALGWARPRGSTALRVPVGNAAPAALPGLERVFHLSGRLYTGAAPEGEVGFRSLERLGIRTVLSVDGMPPDLETARRFGMRYVHLPFGYDGCPAPTADRIVKAVRDLPGPVYLHCHHGRHRAPAAAAFARMALDGLTPAQAVREMARAGTGAHYVGLYNGVRTYHPPTPAELAALPADFPSLTPPPPLAAAMVDIDARFSALTTSGAPPQADDALQLRELLAEVNRTREVAARPTELRELMRAAEKDAVDLESALRTGRPAAVFLNRLAAGCAGCHTRYRDVPQHP
jgi:hypothetical protein